MTQIVIADVSAWDPAIPGVVTLRFSTEGFVDASANYYDGRIQQPANVSRVMYSSQATTGRSQIGFGALVLSNLDGGLDYMLPLAFAGRAVTIKLGEVLPNSGGIPTWTTVLAGVMEQAEFSWQKCTIRVRDTLQSLALPLQQLRYGGTNSLPAGLDGVPADIKGRPKPLAFGQVFNAVIAMVNSTRMIYQAHDGSALQSVDAVYDRGVALSAGSVYPDQATMESTAPAAGQYRVWNSAAGCYIRLGSAATGTVTADLTQGATTAARTAAQLWRAVLLQAGIPSGSISAADVAALDALVAYPVGLYCSSNGGDITALQVADTLMGSVGAWFVPDALGVFRCGRLDDPTIVGTPVGTITTTDIISIDIIASRDPGAGIPAWKIKLAYQRLNYAQIDLSSSVPAARKAYLADEYRRIEASDAGVKTAYLTSPEIEFLTVLVNASDATAEAARRLSIYKVRRDMLQVRVRVDPSLAALLDLGRLVTLQLPRYGMSAGHKFLIIGVRTELRGRLFDLTLWG
jgi:hypothetical protein